MADRRRLELADYKIPPTSPLFKQFIFDALEQVVLNCLHEHDCDDLKYYQLLEDINIFKHGQTSNRYVSEFTEETLKMVLQQSLKVQFLPNRQNERESVVKVKIANNRAQAPSDINMSGADELKVQKISPNLAAIRFLYNTEMVNEQQLKGQWNKPPMGKKKGGLCQRSPQIASEIVEYFGCFLSYLIRSYVSEAKSGDSKAQKKYETKVMQLCKEKLETRLLSFKNELPILDIVYNFFGSARMIDENLIQAVIDRFCPNEYEINHGYLHKRSEFVRGNQSSITAIEIQNRVLHARQDAIVVQTIVPGDATQAQIMKYDQKYIKPATLTAISQVDDKKIAIQPASKMEVDTPVNADDDDGFFMTGIPGIGDDDDKADEFRETRKWRNRTANVLLEDLADEFRELADADDDMDHHFVDRLVEEVKLRDESLDESLEYSARMRDLFSQMFAEKLKQIVDKRELNFPLPMGQLQSHICAYYPCPDVPSKSKNKNFMSPELFEQYIISTVEKNKELRLGYKWEDKNLVVYMIHDPRRVRKERYLQATNVTDHVRKFDFDDGRGDQVKTPNSSSPKTSASPTMSDRHRDWRKIASSLGTQIEKFFQNERGTIHSGFKHNHDDETSKSKTLLSEITPSMQKAYSDLSLLEIDAVFWKLVLNIEEGLLREGGVLLCFAYNEKQQAAGTNVKQKIASGLDFIQFVNRKYPNYEQEVQQWQAGCPLPNGKQLYNRMKLKLNSYIKKQSRPKVEFRDALTFFVRDHELDEYFSGLGGVSSFEEIEFPLFAKHAILNKVLSIIAVQERADFRFDGQTISKVAKRKIDKVDSVPETVQDKTRKMISMQANVAQLPEDLPDATKKLLTSFFKTNTSTLKKDEMDSRPTNVKEIFSYFREAFRYDLWKHGLFEVIGWTLIAEIVLSRTNKDQYCTMIELEAIYPMGAKVVSDELLKKGVKKPRVPRWKLIDINHVLHDLESIFNLKHEMENGMTKSVIVELDEAKFKRLMSEYHNNFTTK